jgi:hypothetical protein
VNTRTRFSLLLAAAAVSLAGCGGVQPVAGGTAGTLSFGDQLLSDIQVTVYESDGGSWTPIGFGVTDREGWFELVSNGARGALWLSPGEYRFTLDSAGAPVQIPTEYTQADSTPLKSSWSEQDGELELKLTSELPLQGGS